MRLSNNEHVKMKVHQNMNLAQFKHLTNILISEKRHLNFSQRCNKIYRNSK